MFAVMFLNTCKPLLDCILHLVYFWTVLAVVQSGIITTTLRNC